MKAFARPLFLLLFLLIPSIAGTDGGSEASERLQVMVLDSPELQRPMRVEIYLPTDYAEAEDRTYPVVYMHDGADAFRGGRRWLEQHKVEVAFERVSWELGRTLDDLFDHDRQTALIVVAIDTDARVEHFSPWPWSPSHDAQGRDYMDFIVHTLKPTIDARYRTNPDRDATAMLGSSFGGMISLYGIVKFPHIFSKAAILSPVLTSAVLGDELNRYIELRGPLEDVQIFFDVGQKESRVMKAALRRTYLTLIQRGFYEENLEMRVVDGGTHLWSSWKIRTPVALSWLFNW